MQGWRVINGKVTLNGSPVFPRGFYYVSFYPERKAQRLADLQKIADAGFNTLHTPLDSSDGALMDKAAALGVSVGMGFNDANGPDYLLRLFANHPALSMIGTFDDVDALNGTTPRYDPAVVKQQSSAWKALAPKAITYASGGASTRILNYIGATDVMGRQIYPVPFEPLSNVVVLLDQVIENFRAAGEPLIANVQTFEAPPYRGPTGAEARNMTYQALVAGVGGIIYYTYYDQVNDMNTKPELWGELVKVGGELNVLEPYLVLGTRQRLTTNSSDTFAAKWKLGSQVVVAVVNTSSSSRSMAVQVGETVVGGAANLFAARQSYMTYSGGALTGTLPAQNVQVYLFNVAG